MLENVKLFQDTPKHITDALAAFSVRRSYPKNTILFMEGDENSQLFIIESGKIRVFVNGEDGKQVTLNFMGEGEYFGELALIDGNPRSASVMTVTDSVFVTVSRKDFQQFIAQHPEYALDMMRQLVSRIRGLTDSVKDMALLDVYGRVSQLLRRLADTDDRVCNPKPTHQEIANMVGASREMVSRIMKELVIGGYIEQQPDALVICKQLPAGW
ncbi:Crp/Fnr family transcriptional regulator [Exilibacterium tricleocarpae]|uniref:Crp/Fnr family transcriptional regulator n=1 Tax=Exilibacterium tricleocarpae TaxID=2591008 RepID=A0A545TN88_9GAMM|nr:Crp/Fnr family transcriptional regulator [Exilibacterium tricleocarpae]TQV78692.1 Crp/Fnr family transcriptional regulator [Exilibacterium tricleocarpae]